MLGGLLSKYVPAIRAPLDIALAVDNHFREFPRTNIPRARIFSRYAALLGHLQGEGYARIVIVAHSLGTVISAELLRYLSSDGRRAPQDGARPRLGSGEGLPAIRLLTLGCPLRQLYAARFQTLYRRVIERRGSVSGPFASDIGVECWANAYCSGDYVGRWLWCAVADDGDPVGHLMLDGVDGAPICAPDRPQCGRYRDFEFRLRSTAHAAEQTRCNGIYVFGATMQRCSRRQRR